MIIFVIDKHVMDKRKGGGRKDFYDFFFELTHSSGDSE